MVGVLNAPVSEGQFQTELQNLDLREYLELATQ
jgi:hypothetical protein